MCWRRLLSPLDSKEINPEYSLEGLMLKLKLQYFGHLMQRADSLGKTLMLGKVEGRRKSGWQRMRWLDGNANSMNMRTWNSRRVWKSVKDTGRLCTAIHGITKCQTRSSDQTTVKQQQQSYESLLVYTFFFTSGFFLHYLKNSLHVHLLETALPLPLKLFQITILLLGVPVWWVYYLQTAYSPQIIRTTL